MRVHAVDGTGVAQANADSDVVGDTTQRLFAEALEGSRVSGDPKAQ